MSKRKKILNKDEVDIPQLILELWNYKFPILIIVFISIICGVGMNYSKINKTEFKINIPYSVLYHSSRVVDLCNVGNLNCLNKLSSDSLIRLIGHNWNYDTNKKIIFSTTSSPLTVENYSDKFNKANQLITNEILKSTIYEINEIEKTMDSENLKNSEFIEKYMKIKKLNYAINNGEKVFFFGYPSIKKIPVQIFPILVFSFIVGIFIAFIYVSINMNLLRGKKP